MIINPDSLRAELDAVRARTPLRPGAKRKRVEFPDDLRKRVCDFARSSDLPLQAVSDRIGLAHSVLRKWLDQSKPELPFIPVEVQSRPQRQNGVQRSDDMVLSVKVTSLKLPADLDPSRLRELVAAMCQGGEPC